MPSDRPDHPVLAISFGGSKIAVGIVAPGGVDVIAQTPRIEWRNHPSYDPQRGFESLLRIVAESAATLLESNRLSITDVGHIGIAWPGPGKYADGLLRATFLPGEAHEHNVHRAIQDSFADRLGIAAKSLRVLSRLDVNARAVGEVRLDGGGLHHKGHDGQRSGIVMNVATGIAGACVRRGDAVVCWGNLGETYGQWGRYVFKDLKSGEWRWRPTADGSIASHSIFEIRLTEYCGGPALVRRYNGSNLIDSFHARDIAAERESLTGITRDAVSGRDRAATFVYEIGCDIGSAVKCVVASLGAADIAGTLILTGGVGELFGRPSEADQRADRFIQAVSSALGGCVAEVRRSIVGLNAELAGLA